MTRKWLSRCGVMGVVAIVAVVALSVGYLLRPAPAPAPAGTIPTLSELVHVHALYDGPFYTFDGIYIDNELQFRITNASTVPVVLKLAFAYAYYVAPGCDHGTSEWVELQYWPDGTVVRPGETSYFIIKSVRDLPRHGQGETWNWCLCVEYEGRQCPVFPSAMSWGDVEEMWRGR